MIKATRAIYPQLSKKARKINNTNICGTKPRTAPTPEITPSTMSPVSYSAHPIPSKMLCAPGMIHSPFSVSFVQSVSSAPTVVTDT